MEVSSRLVFDETSIPGLYIVTFLLCPHMAFCLCSQRGRGRETERDVENKPEVWVSHPLIVKMPVLLD